VAEEGKDLRAYWRRNLQIQFWLLAIWFVAGYVLSIFLVEPLNHIKMGGFPLGFWFAQQGAIYVFVILIFVYCKLMRGVDKEFGVDEDAA
jgi:putative solute:sodium symporter small subunit